MKPLNADLKVNFQNGNYLITTVQESVALLDMYAAKSNNIRRMNISTKMDHDVMSAEEKILHSNIKLVM